MKIFRFILVIIFSTSLFAADSTKISFNQLGPEPQHKKVAPVILKYLTRFHYQKRAIDDSLSSETLDRYFEKLDPSRIYFLESDITYFDKYRYKLDDYLVQGYVEPAYEIFGVYSQRVAERLTYAFARLKTPFNFNADEYLELDRSKVPWAKNSAELDELWRKRLKNEILSLKLSGKKPDEIKKTILKRYNRAQKNLSQLQSEDVFQILINSLSESFDPHTNYFSPKNYDDFMIEMSQAYSGIGARLTNEDEYTVVKEIIPGGPAERSKALHENDRIIGVGQDSASEIVDVIGWRIDDVVQLIRGKKETTVRLQILAAGSTPGAPSDTLTLVRDKIRLEDRSAEGKIIKITVEDKNFHFGIIEIPQFYSDFDGRNAGEKNYKSTTNDVRKLLNSFNTDTLDGIIIDLRRNGGGFLNEAIELTGLFIEKGPVVQVRNTTGQVSVEWDDDAAQVYDGPLAVLVDRISASASEIFAAAIQDYKRGIIIGSQTFGKGTVQHAISLNRFMPKIKQKLGQLKLTVAKFYRIDGGSTQHVGVIPDISFPSRFELMDIGESSQENALLWDRINPVDFSDYTNIDEVIPKLEVRYNLRVSEDTQFADLLKSLEELEKNRKNTLISLNEDKRKKEREEAEKKKKQRENKTDDENDLLLMESARILSDYILLSEN